MGLGISPLPSIGFTLTLPDNTVAAAVGDPSFGASAQAIPNNCKTVIVYNMSTANRLFVRWGTITSGKISADITIGNSTVIPFGSSFTFDIGILGERGDCGDGPASTMDLFLKLESGVSQQVNITYIMAKITNGLTG